MTSDIIVKLLVKHTYSGKLMWTIERSNNGASVTHYRAIFNGLYVKAFTSEEVLEVSDETGTVLFLLSETEAYELSHAIDISNDYDKKSLSSRFFNTLHNLDSNNDTN